MPSEPALSQQRDRRLADDGLWSEIQEATAAEQTAQHPKTRSSVRKKPQANGAGQKNAAAKHGSKSRPVDLTSFRDNHQRDQRTGMPDPSFPSQPPGLLSQELNSTTSRGRPTLDHFNMPGSSQDSENDFRHSPPSSISRESIPDKSGESLIEGLSGHDNSLNTRLNSMRITPEDGRSPSRMMYGVSPSPPTPNLIPRPAHGNNQYAEYSSTPRSFGSIRHNHRHSSLNTYYGSSPMYHHSSGSHFYSAPTEMDFRSFAHGQMPTSSRGSYSFCAFDTLPNLSKPSKLSTGKVLLVGRDDWLEVMSLTHERTHVLGKLENLGGRVVGARFLTWSSSMHDPFASSRPHIAVIIHGQVTNQDSGDSNDFADNMSNISANQGVPHVRTSVEVFSLKTQSHIATFFSTRAVPCPYPEGLSGLPNAAPPGPIGNLRLHASGNYLVVTSGTSGEIYVYSAFRAKEHDAADTGIYQCIGKTWSMIQPQLDQDSSRRPSTNSALSADLIEDHNHQSDGSQNNTHCDTPIFSISGRWIAVVPPASPNMVSLHGTVPPQLTSRHRRQSVIESIESFSPSTRPSVSCLVDEGGGESFFNKFARGLTQEVFKGAKWIGDQGMQTWNSYWNPKEKEPFLSHTPPQQPNVSLPRVYLPPTHGQDVQSHNEPDTISIFDLKRLEEGLEIGRSSYPPTPIATFQPPNGCSYLSLSPSGLMLFASSKKGDLHHVWDIMQMKHRTAKSFHIDDLASTSNVANVPAPLVRLVSRYPRLTTSSVVDVVWAAPWGERIAIVTKKGTVHIHDIPKAAFHWPPPRRFVPNGIVREDTFQSLEDSSKTTTFSSAIKKLNDRAQPIFSAMRNRAPSVGNAITGATRAGALGSAAAGGKVVAAGLTRSVGAATETVNTFRRAGEARLHLSTANGAVPARVAWFGKKPNPLLGVVSDRYFKAYTIHKSLPSKKNKSYSVIGDKTAETRLPASITPVGNSEAQPPPILPPDEVENVSGFWSAPHSSSAMRGFSHDKTLPLSQAVLDSNSPYQPFHTDRRVSLSVYTSPHQGSDLSSDSGEWVFGRNDISTVKLNIHPAFESEEDEPEQGADDATFDGSSEQLVDRPGLPHHAQNANDMENLISVGNAGNTSLDHVVITTRRKKKRPAQAGGSATDLADDDGFFEDDCEVLDFADERV